MKEITDDILRQVMPHTPKAKRAEYLPFINAAMLEFEITTELRAAAFLAQLAHESGELRYMEEIASGSAYEGRRDLGNTEPGDGKRFKGRGPIQLTGRDNYRRFGKLLDIPLEQEPALAASPQVGFRLAAAFWDSKGLNDFADRRQFRAITKRINGGYNGLPERERYYDRALRALPDGFSMDGRPAPDDDEDSDVIEERLVGETDERAEVGLGSPTTLPVTKIEEPKKTDSPVQTVSTNPPAVEVKSQGVSWWSKAQSLWPTTGITAVLGGLKLGGHQFTLTELGIIGGLLVITIVTGAILWDRAKSREQERLKWSQENLANPGRSNVVVGTSAGG